MCVCVCVLYVRARVCVCVCERACVRPCVYVTSSLSSSLGSRCVPWLGKGLSMPSPNYPVLCYPLQNLVTPVFVQVVTPPIGWSPLSSFLVIWSPSGDTRGPSVVLEAVDMPFPGPFHFFLTVLIISMTFVLSLTQMLVLCLFGQCPDLCTICHSWQHTGVVQLSLQADGKVAFKDIPVFGVCRPACHDSS